MLAALLSAAVTITTSGCVGTGPVAFEEGLEMWCSTGLFQQVDVVVEEDDTGLITDFTMSLTLNADGFLVFSKDEDDFLVRASYLIEVYEKAGVRTKIRFFFGGLELYHCHGDREKQKTVCKAGPEEGLIT